MGEERFGGLAVDAATEISAAATTNLVLLPSIGLAPLGDRYYVKCI